MQPDVFDLLDKVSKGAFSVFNNLKFNRSEENNITRYESPEEMSKTDREVLSRRLKELKDVGLICSVKKQIPMQNGFQAYTFHDPRRTFIINPTLIRCANHDEAMYLWSCCVSKGETKRGTNPAA